MKYICEQYIFVYTL